MTDVVCPQCRSVVPVEDVNLDLLLAKCRDCNSVFQFGDQFPELRAARLSPAPLRTRPTQPIPLPSGIVHDESSLDPRFHISWYSAAVWFLGPFCLAWNGFLAVWYSIAFATGAWHMALFGTIHLMVGVGLLYAVLSMLFNRTTINVDRYQLTVRHGPVPARGAVTLASADIDQIYVSVSDLIKAASHHPDYQRRLSGVGFGEAARTGTSPFEVRALLRDGSTARIVNVSTIEQGHYLEQQIEEHLQIVDRPVPGEV